MLLSEAKKILKENNYIIEVTETSEYGDGATIFTPTGADGQWPGRYDFICNAIMHNRVDALKDMLYDGIQIGDYNDGEDDETNTDFDEEYEREFKEDYSLVFKGENINDALEFMLDYDSNFFIAPFDLMNLFHAGEEGCNAKTLTSLLYNYIDAADCANEEAFDDMTWKQVIDKVELFISKKSLTKHDYVHESVEDDGPTPYDVALMNNGRKPSWVKKVTEMPRRPVPIRGSSSYSEIAMRKVTGKREPWRESDLKNDKEWRMKSLKTYMDIISKKLDCDYEISNNMAYLTYNGQPFTVEFEGAGFFVTKIDKDHTARPVAPDRWKSQSCEFVKDVIDFIQENS